MHVRIVDFNGIGVEDEPNHALRVSVVGGSPGGGLTDAELRASPVPFTTDQLPGALVGGRLAVDTGATGGLTDAELRASPVSVDGSGVVQPISATSLPLPSGAATDAGLAAIFARQTDGSQHTVVDASALPSGAATAANQATANASLSSIDGKLSSPVTVTGALTDTQLRATPVPVSGTITVQDGGGAITVDTGQLPAALVGGRLDENVGAWLGSTAPTVGQKTMANSVPVVLPSDQTVSVAPFTSATGTSSNVSGSASSTTLLASNAARKGATIFNDSTAILYVKFGATASVSSFGVKMIAGAYFEMPFSYTGIIDGIWASATGAARVTEFT